MFSYKEKIDFQEIIGRHVNSRTKVETPTTWGTIHYAKDGAHIVPSLPPDKQRLPVDILDVLLDLQRASFNAIVSSLRAITVKVNDCEKTFDFCFFYDEEVTDELFNLASVAATEVDTPLYYLQIEKIEYLDASIPIPIHGELAYLRYEPNFSPVIKKMDRKHLVHDAISAEAVLLLDMQEALFGKVTPALRKVNVYPDIDKKTLQFIFYFDGEISQLDFDLATSVVKEGNWSFRDFKICHEIIRIDYPTKIPWEGKMRAAYARCEEFLKPKNREYKKRIRNFCKQCLQKLRSMIRCIRFYSEY